MSHPLRSTAALQAALLGGAVALAAPACREPAGDLRPPTFRDDVATVVAAKCASCHQGTSPAGGWHAGSYADAVACVAADGAPAARGESAPILRALASPTHAGLVTEAERGTIARWVRAGAPASGAGVHDIPFKDPHAPGSHGRWLHARRYASMLDVHDADACGTCHDGAPVRPAGVTRPAPGATACTTCHDDADGPLACGTCHGVPGGRAHPPREACFHPEARPDTAHARHAEGTSIAGAALGCDACHPTPAARTMGGAHGDGAVTVALVAGYAGAGAAWDPAERRCTTRCHARRDGADPRPSWADTRRRACGDCHGSPPKEHYRGACSGCHREADAEGATLVAGRLHVNGVVDLGDGSGKCGACHGTGDDPWPSSGAHAAHRTPGGAVGVACATCHELPASSGHPRGDTGRGHVRLVGLAAKGGRAPAYDPETRTCANVYCHDAGGGAAPAPRWSDGAPVRACGACHATPPPPPHPASAGCGVGACHGGLVDTTGAPALTVAGARTHVDGVIDLAAR